VAEITGFDSLTLWRRKQEMKVKGFLGILAIASVTLLIACGGGSNANSNANNYNLSNINTRNATNTVGNVAGNVANATGNVASTITNKISNAVGNNSTHSANNTTVTTSSANGSIRGNKGSHIYHLSNCPDYDKIAKANIVTFSSRAEAEKAGYRIAKNCHGEEGARNANKAQMKNSNQANGTNKSNANIRKPQANH